MTLLANSVRVANRTRTAIIRWQRWCHAEQIPLMARSDQGCVCNLSLSLAAMASRLKQPPSPPAQRRTDQVCVRVLSMNQHMRRTRKRIAGHIPTGAIQEKRKWDAHDKRRMPSEKGAYQAISLSLSLVGIPLPYIPNELIDGCDANCQRLQSPTTLYPSSSKRPRASSKVAMCP